MSKDAAALDHWLKDIAPSTTLRKWFGHRPERWQEFRKRYLAELKENRAATQNIRAIAKGRRATLLYSARDTEHNQALVLADYLNRAAPGGAKRAAK
jgi:uncharacterized protein YeaO (DUF488 family)